MQQDNIYAQVNEKSDIVKVISYYLGSGALVRKGNAYLAICPFHNDSHPSMRVTPEKHMFKCFACGEGGNSISFVAKYAHLSNFEALKKVCEICSIPLPESFLNREEYVDNFQIKYNNELNALLDLKKFYQLTLKSNNGKECLEYLKKRKIDEDVISHFELGFSGLNNTDSINTLRKKGYDINTLTKAGILLDKTRDLIDIFSNRLMFPIEDNNGHLVGFSGRIIKKDQEGGKYQNSPESELFDKANILYHFSKAKEDAKRKKYIYIVEGFMDAIAIVRSGIYAVCATMGTAFTAKHALALKSLNVEVRLCLDSDEPGQIGEEKACKILLENNVPFRIVRKFTCGKDADEILTNYSKDVLLKELNRLYDPFLFFLRRTLKDRNRLDDSSEILSFLKNVSIYYHSLDDVSKDKDVQNLMKVCSISKDTILNVLNNSSISKIRESSKDKSEKRTSSQSTIDFVQKFKREDIKVNLGGNYTDLNYINDLINLTKQFDNNNTEINILKNECRIISILPKSHRAFLEFQSSRCTLTFMPFYTLSNLIGEIYLSLPGNKLPFTEYDYNTLKNKLISKPEDNSFDDFLVEESKSFTEDEIKFLNQVIELIEKQSKYEYSEEFTQLLKLQSLYIKYYYLVRKLKTAPLTKEENQQFLILKREIRKNNGTI